MHQSASPKASTALVNISISVCLDISLKDDSVLSLLSLLLEEMWLLLHSSSLDSNEASMLSRDVRHCRKNMIVVSCSWQLRLSKLPALIPTEVEMEEREEEEEGDIGEIVALSGGGVPRGRDNLGGLLERL